MTAPIQSTSADDAARTNPAHVRVTTIISGAGVHSMTPSERAKEFPSANENHWFDRNGFRRRWYANIAAGVFTLGLLWAGVWIVQEFARLQKLEACFEAGRRNCSPLNMERRGP